MNENPEFLCCPHCHGAISINSVRRYRGQIVNGNMVCPTCKTEDPIMYGRPLFISAGATDRWIAPIYEAVGNFNDLQSMQNSIEWLRTHKKSNEIKEPIPVAQFSKELLQQMKYRNSGRWFGTKRGKIQLQRSAALIGSEKGNIIDELLKEIISYNPKRICDIASGGGGGVCRLAANYHDFETIVSVERDVKCSFVVQYKLERNAPGKNTEAIAADVRKMPLKNAWFDTVMCNLSFNEIQGIAKTLSEVSRIIDSKGRFIVLNRCEPVLFDVMNKKDFISYMKKHDVFIGYDNFVENAEKSGLKQHKNTFFTVNNEQFFLSVFIKR